MKIDDIKLKIENLGYEFDSPNSTKIGCEIMGMKEYSVTIHHFKNLAGAIYDFRDEEGAGEYFKRWSDEYKEVSQSEFEELPNLGYKKCEQNVINEGYYCIVIKRDNLVFFANALWKEKDKIKNLLLKINYLK